MVTVTVKQRGDTGWVKQMYTDWESGLKWLKIRYLEWLCRKRGIQVGEAVSGHFPKELR